MTAGSIRPDICTISWQSPVPSTFRHQPPSVLFVVVATPTSHAQAVTVSKATRKSSSSAPGTHSVGARSAESIARTELERRVESLERDLARAGQESRAQSTRATNLQRKLDARGGGGGGAGGRSGSWVAVDSNGGGRKAGENDEGVATADILALKAKATQLVERLRQEKTARLKAERRTQGVAGKVHRPA